MARPRIRSGTHTFNVMHHNIDGTWHVLGRVSFQQAERKCDAGKWVRIYNQQDRHVGYEICESDSSSVLASLERQESSKARPGPVSTGARSVNGVVVNDVKSPLCISAKEVEVFAGQVFERGKSKTASMSEEQRANRRNERGDRLPEEDAVERVAAKVALWPYPASRVACDERAPYGDRAVRVYPKA